MSLLRPRSVIILVASLGLSSSLHAQSLVDAAAAGAQGATVKPVAAETNAILATVSERPTPLPAVRACSVTTGSVGPTTKQRGCRAPSLDLEGAVRTALEGYARAPLSHPNHPSAS